MTSSVTLLHCLKNTHFLYYKWISFIFSLKYFEEKCRTRLLLCIFCLQYGTLFPPKVDIYFHDDRSRFCYERLRFSWWQVEIFLWTVGISMMTGRDFIMSDWNSHDDRSRFYYEWLKFSRWRVQIVLWTVEIFVMTSRDSIMNDWDFHDDRSKFYYERLRFSWWQVEMFMITITVVEVVWFRRCFRRLRCFRCFNLASFFHFVFKITIYKCITYHEELHFYYYKVINSFLISVNQLDS